MSVLVSWYCCSCCHEYGVSLDGCAYGNEVVDSIKRKRKKEVGQVRIPMPGLIYILYQPKLFRLISALNLPKIEVLPMIKLFLSNIF